MKLETKEILTNDTGFQYEVVRQGPVLLMKCFKRPKDGNEEINVPPDVLIKDVRYIFNNSKFGVDVISYITSEEEYMFNESFKTDQDFYNELLKNVKL